MGWDIVIQAADTIHRWLHLAWDRQQRLETDEEEGLRCLLKAVHLTRTYIADTRAGFRVRDRGIEAQIASAWSDAGVQIRRLGDSDNVDFQWLYRRCFEKSSYWQNPIEWDEVRIAEAGISLDALFQDLLEFIDTRRIARG